ncbi:MAG TPA: alpha/beta hydrolase, partial [Longimicrobiales bacterium]|nr:alpha/beta hydrolase [Longimicrobiales bacterium]
FDAPLRGGIIVSPWLETDMPITRWKSTLGHALNRILPALPFESGLEPSHLSHDPAIVQAYRDDPLVHARITPRLFAETSQAMGLVFQRSERIHVPLFLLLAGDDRIVSTQRSQAFARSLAAKNVAVRVYANAYHEVLNEPVRAESLRDLRDWVAARLAASMPKRQHIPASALHDWDSNYAGKGYGGGN